MSLRIDTTEWISGALLIGETGLGVLGQNIPSTGDNGPGYTYNDLSLPADNAKEICGRITSWPSAGTLFANEDTSFTFSGAPDGTYTFQYQLYVDGVATGSPATVTLTVGSTGTVALSGQAYSYSQGGAAPSASIILSGQTAPYAQGGAGLDRTVTLSGQSLAFALGAITATTGTVISLVGQAQPYTQGGIGVTSSSTPALSGQALPYAQGVLSVGISQQLGGQTYAYSQGAVATSIGATVALTGVSYSYSQGVVSPSGNAAVMLSGSSLAFGLGAVVPVGGVSVLQFSPNSNRVVSTKFGAVVFSRMAGERLNVSEPPTRITPRRKASFQRTK